MPRHLLFIWLAMSALSGCVEITAAWADLDPSGKETARPPLAIPSGPQAVHAWESESRPDLQRRLQEAIYGIMPSNGQTAVLEKRVLDPAAFSGAGTLEKWTLNVRGEFAEAAFSSGPMQVHVLIPHNRPGPHPIILIQSFCPARSTLQHPAMTDPDDDAGSGGIFGAVATYVFGRFICTPPVEDILASGYGIAIIDQYAFVPDDSTAGLATLREFAKSNDETKTRWGAIGAWGWLYARVAEAVESDPRINADAVIAWGHSRYAKAALVAAAFFPQIDGVIAHQSGTGGASLNWNKPGESVRGIIKNYPHWFAPGYADFIDASDGKGPRPDLDQHMLLALIAPRPVFLGNARRDVWSDPNGAFRAAKGAQPAYALYGATGLNVGRLNEFEPAAELAFWLRPGTHGVVEEDWPAFLQFLYAHFPATNRKSCASKASKCQ